MQLVYNTNVVFFCSIRNILNYYYKATVSGDKSDWYASQERSLLVTHRLDRLRFSWTPTLLSFKMKGFSCAKLGHLFWFLLDAWHIPSKLCWCASDLVDFDIQWIMKKKKIHSLNFPLCTTRAYATNGCYVCRYGELPFVYCDSSWILLRALVTMQLPPKLQQQQNVCLLKRESWTIFRNQGPVVQKPINAIHD